MPDEVKVEIKKEPEISGEEAANETMLRSALLEAVMSHDTSLSEEGAAQMVNEIIPAVAAEKKRNPSRELFTVSVENAASIYVCGKRPLNRLLKVAKLLEDDDANKMTDGVVSFLQDAVIWPKLGSTEIKTGGGHYLALVKEIAAENGMNAKATRKKL